MRIGMRLDRLERYTVNDEASIYLAADDESARQLCESTTPRPMVLITGEAEHDPPVRASSIRGMLKRVAKHGRSIADRPIGPMNSWRLWNHHAA